MWPHTRRDAGRRHDGAGGGSAGAAADEGECERGPGGRTRRRLATEPSEAVPVRATMVETGPTDNLRT